MPALARTPQHGTSRKACFATLTLTLIQPPSPNPSPHPNQGVLRDWDMVRGFIVGGLGVTWRHVPTVALAAALLALVPLLLLCGAVRACVSWQRRRRGKHPHARVGSDPDAARLVPPEFD